MKGLLYRLPEPLAAREKQAFGFRVATRDGSVELALSSPQNTSFGSLETLRMSIPWSGEKLDLHGGWTQFRHRNAYLEEVSAHVSVQQFESLFGLSVRRIDPASNRIWLSWNQDLRTVEIEIRIFVHHRDLIFEILSVEAAKPHPACPAGVPPLAYDYSLALQYLQSKSFQIDSQNGCLRLQNWVVDLLTRALIATGTRIPSIAEDFESSFDRNAPKFLLQGQRMPRGTFHTQISRSVLSPEILHALARQDFEAAREMWLLQQGLSHEGNHTALFAGPDASHSLSPIQTIQALATDAIAPNAHQATELLRGCLNDELPLVLVHEAFEIALPWVRDLRAERGLLEHALRAVHFEREHARTSASVIVASWLKQWLKAADLDESCEQTNLLDFLMRFQSFPFDAEEKREVGRAILQSHRLPNEVKQEALLDLLDPSSRMVPPMDVWRYWLSDLERRIERKELLSLAEHESVLRPFYAHREALSQASLQEIHLRLAEAAWVLNQPSENAYWLERALSQDLWVEDIESARKLMRSLMHSNRMDLAEKVAVLALRHLPASQNDAFAKALLDLALHRLAHEETSTGSSGVGFALLHSARRFAGAEQQLEIQKMIADLGIGPAIDGRANEDQFSAPILNRRALADQLYAQGNVHEAARNMLIHAAESEDATSLRIALDWIRRTKNAGFVAAMRTLCASLPFGYNARERIEAQLR